MESPTVQPRQTAYIVSIEDIVKSRFFKEEGWNPNYVLIGGKQVSRVNIIGVVISSSTNENVQTISIDDGSGKINVRNFEENLDVSVGDVVLLVARIRQHGNELYLAPEIIKKNINKKWSLIWKKLAIKRTENDEIEQKDNKKIEEDVVEEDIEEKQSYRDKVIERIKELDKGEGAPYEELIKTTSDEKYIAKLILDGDIFEIKPGKLKVLE